MSRMVAMIAPDFGCSRTLLVGGALTLGMACGSLVFGQDPTCSPGVERWGIKTHLKQGGVNSAPQSVSLDDLVSLDWHGLATLPDWKTTDDCLRTPGASGPQECDIVSLEGYVQLVAHECAKKKNSDEHTDGDYHIQISSARDVRDGVVIVEVPSPAFVDDPDLKSAVDALRQTLREKLNGGKEFSMSNGTCMQHPPRMRIVGQLFFDSPHASLKEGADLGGGRGKSGHKAATIWELHPVFKMEFLDPKDPTKDSMPCP